MRKGMILNLKRFKLFDYVTLNKIFILLCVVFIVGIAAGSTVYHKNTAFIQLSNDIFDNYIEIHSKSWFLILVISFLNYLAVLLLYFLSGTSMLGVAITPFLTVWQGIVYGILSSYLYSTYTLKGIAFNAIILVPPLIIFTICSFFAARESINFSLLLAKLTLPKSRPANVYTDFKKYCGKFIIFIIIALVSATSDLVLNLLFLHFFNF